MIPKVHAYLRVSSESQRPSLACTESQARDLAAKLCADGTLTMGEFIGEAESAVLTRWNARPGFTRLMRLMRPGDHLIIEAEDRLERDDVEMLVCLQWLKRRKIILHCLMSNNGAAIDLNDDDVQIMSHVKAIVAAAYTKGLKIRIREAHRYRKENGFAYGKTTPWGMKMITLPPAPGQKKSYKAYAWDDKQCAILREIVRLYDREGWSFVRIGVMLRNRGDTTQFGGQWATRFYDNKMGCKRWQGNNVTKAYKHVTAMRANGMDLGGMPFIPSTVTLPPPVKPPRPPALPKPPPKPCVWKGKPWMHRLLAKWAATKNGTSSSAACPSANSNGSSPERSEQPCLCPSPHES